MAVLIINSYCGWLRVNLGQLCFHHYVNMRPEPTLFILKKQIDSI